MRACAFPGCERLIYDDLVGCFKHWRFVPEALRRAFWRSFSRGGGDAARAACERALAGPTEEPAIPPAPRRAPEQVGLFEAA